MADVARRAAVAIRAEGHDPATMQVQVDENKWRWKGVLRSERWSPRVEDPRYVAVYFDPLPTTPPTTDGSVWLLVDACSGQVSAVADGLNPDR